MTYTIGKTSEIVGLSTYTLRYYELEQLLLPVKRDSGGKRIYGKEDIEWIKLIVCFKKTGMPVSEIKDLVKLILEGNHTIPKRLEKLRKHKENILHKINNLKENLEKI